MPEVPELIRDKAAQMLMSEPMWKTMEFLYNAGARAALRRLRSQAEFRRDHVDAGGDAFRLGKESAYDWTVEAVAVLIEEYGGYGE